MSRRATGVAFIVLAAAVFMSRYVILAISREGRYPISKDMGAWPQVLSAIALLVGVGYLVAAERRERSRARDEHHEG